MLLIFCFKRFWTGSQPVPPHAIVGPWLTPCYGLLRKFKSNILKRFPARQPMNFRDFCRLCQAIAHTGGSKLPKGNSNPQDGENVLAKCGALNAPAVPLGVLKRALHLFPQNFCENRSAHCPRTRLRDVGGSVAAREHPGQRL